MGDVPTIPLPFVGSPPFPPLARGRVAAVGDPIVAIVAESAGAARDAADLVEIEYDPQPAVASAEAALEPNAPRVHPELESNVCYTLKREGGDVDRALQEADAVIQVRVVNPLIVEGQVQGGIAQAVGQLASLGIQHLDLPYSPDRVWEAIQSASSREGTLRR